MAASRFVTFVSAAGVGPDADRLAALLAGAGVELDPPPVSIRSLVDTFDGRLYRRGLRAEVRSDRPSGPFELTVSGADGSSARVVVGAVGAVDEVGGPVGRRLAAVAGGRVLEQRVTLVAPSRRGVLRDPDGNTVAIVTLTGEGRWGSGGIRSSRRGWGASPSAVEVELLTDRRKRIERLMSTVLGSGAEVLDGDLLNHAMDVFGVPLAGLDTSPSTEIPPDLPAGEGVRLLLAHLTTTIDATWAGTADARDIEYLHEFRIAVRRTRTVLAACRRLLPDTAVAHGRALFTDLSMLTGPARDLDVTVVDWPELTASLDPEQRAALEPLLALFIEQRAAAHGRLTAGLRGAPMRRRMEAWRATLAAPFDASGAGTTADEVEARIRRAHRRLIDHGRAITPESPAEQLHSLRKDAKKLRYLIECFADLLRPKPTKRFTAHLKQLQDVLGRFQDSEVQAGMLRHGAAELGERGESIDTLLAVGGLVASLDDRRSAARDVFAGRFGEFDTDEVRATLHALFREVET